MATIASDLDLIESFRFWKIARDGTARTPTRWKRIAGQPYRAAADLIERALPVSAKGDGG